MNKDTEVLLAEYDSANGVFSKIIDVYNIEYAPYILKSFYVKDNINNDLFRANISEWFRGRGIPSWRDRLDLLLHRLNINAPSELLDKSFGLSLSDQYWIKPFDLEVNYDEINFFDNDFDYIEFMEASLSKNSKLITSENSLKTPNNTTDGMLKKAWVIEGGTRYLLKGGYKNEVLQPFNEVLASLICERLGFNHVTYTLDIYKDIVVSKCPCFVNKDTELITCNQIKNDMKRHNSKEDLEYYIDILEKYGIKEAREKIENMYILDFLVMNEDRHLNNFGIIRDVNTLKWLDVAPIFDNGQSLNIKYYDEEELHISGEGRLFYEVKSFDEIIKVVKDIKRVDVSKLEGLPEEFEKLLHNYQNITGISDKRIYQLCILLERQINKLKTMVEHAD
jgi:hypothetical protein